MSHFPDPQSSRGQALSGIQECKKIEKHKAAKQNAQRELINTPGSVAKYFLQFSKNKLTIIQPWYGYFSGRIN
jgi:hypothetical protein